MQLTHSVPPGAPPGDDTPAASPSTGVLRGVIRRQWRIIGAVTGLAAVLAAFLVATAPARYQGVTTIRIDEKELDLSDMVRALSTGGPVITEMAELRSRTLAEEAAAALGMQLQLAVPQDLSRSDLLDSVRVSAEAPLGQYALVREAPGSFAVERLPARTKIGSAHVGAVVELPGVSFGLLPRAHEFPEIRLVVSSLEQAATAVGDGLDVDRDDRQTSMVTVSYTSADSELAWRVPNALAAAFTARRQTLRRADALGTAAFLRAQLDTVTRQLNQSEQAFRAFKERSRSVSPDAEANGQVDRLVKLQAERASINAERVALAKLLEEVRAAAAAPAVVGAPSPYRQLMAFPTLLRNGGAPELLRTLANLEKERGDLLIRRTPRDPDVQAISARVSQVEEQLRMTAETYLTGLADQVAAFDTAAATFGREMQQLPAKQMAYAQLARTPKVLENIASLLQTRLKEAEIAAGVDHDANVRVVDEAVPPLGPMRSRRPLYGAALIVLGMLTGLALAITREFLDRSVHTRADVSLVTGLPVLGLIPYIRKTNRRALHGSNGSSTRVRFQKRGRQSRLLRARKARASTAMRVALAPAVPTSDHDVAADPTCYAAELFGPPGTPEAAAYDNLQINLAFLEPGRSPRTLVFTSALVGDGKTTTAVNLAIALSRRGKRTLLVDADLRRGAIAALLGLRRSPGLSEVLGGVPWQVTRQVIPVPGGEALHCITTGERSRSPSVLLLDSPKLRELLAQWRSEYETIIFDASPATLVPDAALLGAVADGTVMVVRAGVTDVDALMHAAEHFRQVHVNLLGVVLNAIDFAREAGYDGAYHLYEPSAYLAAGEGTS